MAWSSVIAGVLKLADTVAKHTLKPAKEKLQDLRLRNLKAWWKAKKRQRKDQEHRLKRLDEIKARLKQPE